MGTLSTRLDNRDCHTCNGTDSIRVLPDSDDCVSCSSLKGYIANTDPIDQFYFVENCDKSIDCVESGLCPFIASTPDPEPEPESEPEDVIVKGEGEEEEMIVPTFDETLPGTYQCSKIRDGKRIRLAGLNEDLKADCEAIAEYECQCVREETRCTFGPDDSGNMIFDQITED